MYQKDFPPFPRQLRIKPRISYYPKGYFYLKRALAQHLQYNQSGLVIILTSAHLKGFGMFNEKHFLKSKMVWRKKARLNICIAKDLANDFGGKKADYLKRLNHKLKVKMANNHGCYSKSFRMAA